MAKRNAKAQKSNELDGAEFFAAIRLIEQEKGIPKEYMIEKITQALVSASVMDGMQISASFIDGAVLLALGLWLQFGQSRICAILTL